MVINKERATQMVTAVGKGLRSSSYRLLPSSDNGGAQHIFFIENLPFTIDYQQFTTRSDN